MSAARCSGSWASRGWWVTILARGGGHRATDHFELFAPPRLNPDTGMHEMFFLLRGVRHLPSCTEERILALSPGGRLLPMLDFKNSENRRAITLRTGDPPHLVGYLPDYLVDDVDVLRQHERSSQSSWSA